MLGKSNFANQRNKLKINTEITQNKESTFESSGITSSKALSPYFSLKDA